MEDKFLTDKRIFLNNPGKQKSDLYYTKDNSEVDMVESTFWTGRYHTGLTNRSFGGSGSANIPNQMFVGSAYLQVALPPIVANQTLQRGWLFGLINRIDYVFGGANVGNLTINGQTLFQTIMVQCETAEKRSQMLRLAGEEQLSPTTQNQSASIILPLPFSGACGLYHKKPYDTSLLSDPIQINVYFNTSASIYGGDGIRPTAMSSAELILRQGELSNPGQGLKPILRKIPEALYNYPILHHQSFITQFSSSTTVGSKGTYEGRFDLQQFIDADLVGIYIGVIKNTNLNPGSNFSPNQFDYTDVTDVEILWNGTILYRAQDNLHELMQINQNIGGSYWENSIIAPAAIGPFASSPVNNNMIMVDLSRVREECFDGKFSNTFRIAQQTLSAVINVPDLGENYTVYCTYVYNGMISTQSKGTSLIYFN